jgi:hypothetical protein
VFDHFPKYHIKVPIRDFNEKFGREDTFKPTVGNESLPQDSNENSFRIANIATSEKSSR